MKKFTALFLVFSLLTLSVEMNAQEKLGAELLVQKNDGIEVRGELLAVKKTELLLLNWEKGVNLSVQIDDIR